MTLTVDNHDRKVAGLRYLYPVISRRAGGLSIGVNLNPNQACNWRCVYCQVPGLVRGVAPELDHALFCNELHGFLQDVLQGDFYDHHQLPDSQRVIKDIAISGDGEPTTLKRLPDVIEEIGSIASEFNLFPGIGFVLITNGSLMHQSWVQEALQRLNEYGGEVWFKLDGATYSGRAILNGSRQSDARVIGNLKQSAFLCTTSIQTCWFHYDHPDYDFENEYQAFIALLAYLKEERVTIKKVMLYTLARPSYQPEAPLLTKMTLAEMEERAQRIRDLGYEVSISV